MRNLLAIAVNILGGLFIGYTIGFPAVYMTYMDIGTDCTIPATPASCTSLGSGSNCLWNASRSQCVFNDGINCSQYSKTDCGVDRLGSLGGSTTPSSSSSSCRYDYSSNKCVHLHGWTDIENGIFASAMITGGLFGALFSGMVAERFGHRAAMLGTTSCNLVGCIFTHLFRHWLSYGGVVSANVLVGVGIGALQVVGPMYVAESAAPADADRIGMVLQVALTFGIFVAGLLGYAFQPPSSRDVNIHSLHMELRFQGFIGVMTLLAVTMVPLSLALRPTKLWLERRQKTTKKTHDGSSTVVSDSACDDHDSLLPDSGLVPKRSGTTSTAICSLGAMKYVAVATWLAISIQLTGINSIMVYAPKLTRRVGFSSLMGNLAVDFWNFVTTLVTLRLVKHVSPRKMYLVGLAVVTAVCLLAGVVILPGVLQEGTVKHALAGVAIFGFIAAFEMGMGGPFYVLAQMLFPLELRGIGTGFTIGINNVFNIVVNFAFPVGVTYFSGGQSADQDRGIAIWFFIFGCLGLASCCVLAKWLRPATEGGLYTVHEHTVEQAAGLSEK